MNETESNKLDELLRDWSEHSEPDAEHLSNLQQTILDRWDSEQTVSPPTPAELPTGRSQRSALAIGISLGALATSVVVLIWNAASSVHQPIDIATVRDQPPPKFAWLSDAQLADKAILRDELISVFDRRFGWIAETGEGLEIGVEERPDTHDSPSVAVRVIVERRTLDSSEWETVWAVDVVALSEEQIEISPKSEDLKNFRMWAYALPDGMISIDTGLTIAGSAPMTTENLQRDGKPSVIFKTRTDAHEFRVLQAAAVL